MADNVTFQPTPATPVTGTIVSTDELAGAVQVQNVKLMDGTSASSQIIASGNGVHGAALRVTVASDSTGTIGVTSATFATAAKQDTSNTALASIDTSTAGAATSLAIIDDWDESDRAKVNPIVGQAGVAAGAGAVGVTVQRTTLASDDPAVASLATAVASLSAIDDWDESDRAKVNPIAGQAGVAAGAGAVAATVQRVTLASDDPLVASQAIATTIYNGQNAVATAGTQEALASSQVVKSVTIRAHATNTGNIFVGDSAVDSSTGYILSPGDTISMDITDLATVYIDSAVNGESVSYVAVG